MAIEREKGTGVVKAPRPRKIPSLPSDTQAAALQGMIAKDRDGNERCLVRYRGFSMMNASYHVEASVGRITVREPTFQSLLDYKWIDHLGAGSDEQTKYDQTKFYRISQAGREALARYEAKKASKTAEAGSGDSSDGEASAVSSSNE